MSTEASYKKMRPMTQSQREKLKRKVRANNNLCTRCGKPLDCDGKLCNDCRDYTRNYQKDRRDWYKSQGICPICGKNDIFEWEYSCIECKVKMQEYNEKHSEMICESQKNLRKRRREQGLCASCGKPSEKYRCPECAAKNGKKKKNQPPKYTRENWKSNLQCAICGGEPLVPGKEVCEKCYARILNSTEKREKKYESGELERTNNGYWKRTNADMIIHARKRSRVSNYKD